VSCDSPPSSAEVKIGGAIPPLAQGNFGFYVRVGCFQIILSLCILTSCPIILMYESMHKQPLLLLEREIISIYLSIYLWLYNPLLNLGRFFSFLILYSDGMTPWTVDQPVAGPLHTHITTQTQNKPTQTSIPWVGFEPTIPALERAKRVHVLDHAATVNGRDREIRFSENIRQSRVVAS
jgi:hypothetical protein